MDSQISLLCQVYGILTTVSPTFCIVPNFAFHMFFNIKNVNKKAITREYAEKVENLYRKTF